MTVTIAGPGLHTGAPCTLTAAMRRSGGVVFHVDNRAVPVTPHTLCADARWATDVAGDGARVRTIEHLAAALLYAGWAADVVVDGPEIPMVDGSAAPFFRALVTAGWPVRPPPPLHLEQPIQVASQKSWARLVPVADPSVCTYRVVLDGPLAACGIPHFAFAPFSQPFTCCAGARTFALASQIPAMRAAGCARGAHPADVLVLDDGGALTPGGMLWPDEPARHKMLDLLGDLAALGGLPCADLTVFRPGHHVHRALVTAVAAHIATQNDPR